MKKILLRGLLFAGMLFGAVGFVSAQSNNGNGNGNPPSHTQSSISMQTAVKVLKEAAPVFGENLGTLVSRYTAGSCTIIRQVENIYAVSFGGGLAIVSIESDL